MRLSSYNSLSTPAPILVDVPGNGGGASPYSPEVIKRLMGKGAILCTRCHVKMGEVCPRCGKAKCYIALYWKRKGEKKGTPYRYFLEKQTQQPFSFWTATAQLITMSGEMKAEKHPTHPIPFNPLKWHPSGSSSANVKSLLDKWIKYHEENSSPGTVHSYSSYTENYYKPNLGHLAIDDIDRDIVRDFRKKIPSRLKLSYQRCIMNGLYTFMSWCLTCEDAYYAGPVPAFPDIKGNDSEPPVSLTVDEQEEELARIPEKHRDIYEFGCETGLRSGELSVLKISDINRFKRDATIRRTESDREVRELPKSRVYKIIHLSDRAMEIALKHMKGRENKDDFLFMNPASGRRYTVQVLWRYANRYTIHKLPVHQMIRHSFSTQTAEAAAELGIHEKYVQEANRHSDIRTTNRYTHTRETVMRKLMNHRQKVVNISRKSE